MTGASSGIGEASALRLASAGMRLIVHGQDQTRLSDVARRTGAVALAADLSEPAEVDLLARRALAVAGRVDIVVNNAGIGWAGSFAEMAPIDIERVVSVNLMAPIRLTRALLPPMCQRGAGWLIFISSIAGRMGVAGEAVYAATKAGLDLFAESLHGELRGSGVGVGIVVPAAVRTAFFERSAHPYTRRYPRVRPPDDVAEAVMRIIASGGVQRYVPGWLRLPVAVRGAAPGLARALAARFGSR